MGFNIANEGHAEQAETRLRSHASVTMTDAQKGALRLVKATQHTRGSLAQKDGATVLFSQGWCRVRSEGDTVTLQTEAQSEHARQHVEEVMSGHLRQATGDHELQIDWVRED